jgi:hypothetical protein
MGCRLTFIPHRRDDQDSRFSPQSPSTTLGVQTPCWLVHFHQRSGWFPERPPYLCKKMTAEKQNLPCVAEPRAGLLALRDQGSVWPALAPSHSRRPSAHVFRGYFSQPPTKQLADADCMGQSMQSDARGDQLDPARSSQINACALKNAALALWAHPVLLFSALHFDPHSVLPFNIALSVPS